MQQSPSKGRWLLVFFVVILVIVAWWMLRDRRDGKSASDQPVPVTAAAAYEGTLVTYVSQPGIVKPAYSVVVRSRVDGQITQMSFTGGQTVKQGDLLAEVDPRPYQARLQQAAGDLARSQAELDHAEDTLKRLQILLEQDSITKQRVADQQAIVRQTAAAVQANQARVDTSNLELSYTRITAPISGVVGLRRIDPGNMISASDTDGITIVTQSQPSIVTFSIPVTSAGRVLGWLRNGTCVPVNAYADGLDDQVGSGFLRAANNQANLETGTVKLEAQFDNREGTLLPNQFVTVRMPDRVSPNAILVPTAAIQRGAAGAFVYVIDKDKTVAVTPIKVGPGDATVTAVVSGLASGAQVVVEGADRLRAGTQVKITGQLAPPASPTDGLPQCQRAATNEPGHAANQSPHAAGRIKTPTAKLQHQPAAAAKP